MKLTQIDRPQATHKKCFGPCGKNLPLEEFYRSKLGKYGRKSRCKKCHKLPSIKEKLTSGYKRCSNNKCREIKPVSEFCRANDRANGYSSHCKSCKHEYYKNNIDRITVRQKEYYKNNLEANRAKRSRRRAKIKGNGVGIIYQLSVYLERQKHECAYCGCTENEIPPSPRSNTTRWELDHVIPIDKGGPDIDWNIVASCWPCNNSKLNKLIEEWRPELHPKFKHITDRFNQSSFNNNLSLVA